MSDEMLRESRCDEVFLCRASGEGSHNFRVAAGEAGVCDFYREMFGEDHGGGIESLTSAFHDPDEWGNDGTTLDLELYCAKFEVWKVDPKELGIASEKRGCKAKPWSYGGGASQEQRWICEECGDVTDTERCPKESIDKLDEHYAVRNLRAFIINGCDARPSDRHHALQDLDEIVKLVASATAFTEARDKILLEAMEAVAGEHLESPQNDEDRAYDVGVTDAYCAVKRLLRTSTQTTPMPRIEKAIGLAHFLKGYGEPGGANDPTVLKTALQIIEALRPTDRTGAGS